MNRRQKQLLKLQKLQEETARKNKEALGKPHHPSNKEAEENWKKRIAVLEPRTFYFENYG